MKEDRQQIIESQDREGKSKFHCLLVVVCIYLMIFTGVVGYLAYVQTHQLAQLSINVHQDDQLFDSEPAEEAAWIAFKDAYGKRYSPQEDSSRKAIFLRNRDQVIRHNEDRSQSYKKAVYHFHDWNPSEMKMLHGAVRPTQTQSVNAVDPTDWKPHERLSIPNSVDYSSSPCMPPIRNQFQCGSCWSFSALAPMEYQYCRKYGKNVSLSEQQLVDCSTPYGNHGCEGGWYTSAWQYINSVGGVESEAAYPYTARDGRCMFSPINLVANVVSASWAKSEPVMKAAVHQMGVISVSIFANANFQQYRGGVFKDPTCPTYSLNHAVNIVGYGTDPVDGDYWIVRNSWGREWGENGYIRMARGVNICNINYAPAFPYVA